MEQTTSKSYSSDAQPPFLNAFFWQRWRNLGCAPGYLTCAAGYAQLPFLHCGLVNYRTEKQQRVQMPFNTQRGREGRKGEVSSFLLFFSFRLLSFRELILQQMFTMHYSVVEDFSFLIFFCLCPALSSKGLDLFMKCLF